MKGGLAAAYMALWCLTGLGVELPGDLYLESVVNEEYGGATGTLAGRLRYPDIDGAIIMEPTNLALATGHRGGLMWRIIVEGKPGRSFSGEQTVNPVFPLCAILQDLEAFNQERNQKRRAHGLPGPLPIEISQVKAGPVEWEMGERVPNEAWATLWVEIDPDDVPTIVGDQIITFLAARRSLENVRFIPIILPLLGSSIPHDSPLARTVASAMKDADLDITPVTAPFACDGAMFNRCSNTPMLLLGPIGGNAHAHDEWVSVTSLQQLTAVLATTAVMWAQE
jgi:acetylornithine deacetylase